MFTGRKFAASNTIPQFALTSQAAIGIARDLLKAAVLHEVIAASRKHNLLCDRKSKIAWIAVQLHFAQGRVA